MSERKTVTKKISTIDSLKTEIEYLSEQHKQYREVELDAKFKQKKIELAISNLLEKIQEISDMENKEGEVDA